MKANVLFFDKVAGGEHVATEALWVYDFRTNGRFTLRERPLKRADLDDFVTAYQPAHRRHKREEGERFRRLAYADLAKRDKLNLDIFWLKDAGHVDPTACRRRTRSRPRSSRAWSWRWRNSKASHQVSRGTTTRSRETASPRAFLRSFARVAAAFYEVATFFEREGSDEHADLLDQCVVCLCFDLAQMRLQLGEHLLDRVEVGAVGRQVEDAGAYLADRCLDAGNLVGCRGCPSRRRRRGTRLGDKELLGT